MNRFGLFCGDGIDYAVPLARLVKVLPARHCYLLPNLPVVIGGVIVADGELVPRLELSRMLVCVVGAIRPAAYQVLVESECGTLALPAERPCGIVAEQKGEVLPLPEPAARGLLGEFRFKQKKFQILDLDSLAIGLIQTSW